MSNINLTAPNGWNKWIYAKSVANTVQIPDASFPYIYAPSSGFFGRSLITHCLIPWLNVPDAYSLFLFGGGSSGTLPGSIGGLSVVADLFEISVNSQTFGIGRGAEPPQMGFCIGNKFKQHVYTRIDVQNDGLGHTIATNVNVDLLQNSRFKKAYVHHGSVSGYTNNNSTEYILKLDIVRDTPPPTDINLKGTNINILTNNNGVFTDVRVNVLGIKNNWDFVISAPSIDIKSGDYYKIYPTLCLEDPYLLSGFWIGSEVDAVLKNTPPRTKPSSGYDLYVTSHNSPYEEGKFLGEYIWKTDPTVAEISNGASSVVSSPPASGSSMNDVVGFTWSFFGIGNSPDYNVYPNDDRYREVNLSSPSIDGSIVNYNKRIAASYSDYKKLFTLNPSYLRVEIGTGGGRDRHNWYAPCLTGEYIKIKKTNKLHKILAHVGFNIIDISAMDITNTSVLDIVNNQEYSIINQNAWFISEHYDGRISTTQPSVAANTGIFKGYINNIENDKKLTIYTLSNTYISTLKKNGLSFIDRYQNSIDFPNSMKKCYNDFNGWKLVSNNKEYDIESIDFSTDTSSYYITVTISSSSKEIIQGDSCYIVFDSSFPVYGNFSKESGYSLIIDVQAGLSNPQNSGLIISNELCLDGEFITNPYRLNISSSDRIGFCEGYLFGLAANGTAQSSYNQTMLFTVPRTSIGVASLFHKLREEDWVVYQDAVNGKLTIRKGSLDFSEYPAKSMVVIGKSKKTQYISGSSVINLDATQEMLRRIGITFSSTLGSSTDIAILFNIGSTSNAYGFYVSGDGSVNLGFLNKQNKKALSSDYKGDGYDVSPVYVYKPSYYQNLLTRIVDIGINTVDGPIYMNGGDISSVQAEYIDKNQTISQVGFFDLIRLSDGEEFLIYGQQVNDFLIGDNLNNSTDNGSVWSNQNAIMMIGTYNDAFIWSTPTVGRIDDKDDTNQYPLMILNSVDYLSCIYNQLNQTIMFFCRCTYDENSKFLGGFIVSINTLTHKNILCDPISTDYIKFKWRPPILLDTFITDKHKSWTGEYNFVADGFSYVNSPNVSTDSMESISGVKGDSFIRIMGNSLTNSQIKNENEFGIISSTILPDGTYVIFYDSSAGIKALYSTSSGNIWKTTANIYADGSNAVLIENILYYISKDGIVAKKTNITDFYRARDISEGIITSTEEVRLQSDLNQRVSILIGSGIIESQRLSGYTTICGITKIFFYDQNNLLKCMETKDNNTWYIANNF